MAVRYLVITEVSQKQAYIFSRNELQLNVQNSSAIAWITSPDYFRKAVGGDVFNEGDNLVYAGGGHSVLQFETEEKAREFCRKLTLKAHDDFPKMELFVKITPYREDIDLDAQNRVVKLDPAKTPEQIKTNAANIRYLIGELEKKKSLRSASFHQGTFGVEYLDATDLSPVLANDKSPEHEALNTDIWKYGQAEDRKVLPEDYTMPTKFEKLGGSKGESNFIAVIHIDGNGMGNRVLEYQKTLPGDPGKWDVFRKELRKFSSQIDADFKEAFFEMNRKIAGNLKRRDPDKKEFVNRRMEELTLEPGVLPVRRIITSGDDICFVTEGRIGIEAAALFVEELRGKCGYDGRTYAACGGVAIVHRKFPFYRAYDLAEQLCSHAKAMNADIGGDCAVEISSIDWHIEFGEMQDRLRDIRNEYGTADGKRLELRPYIVCEPETENSYDANRRYGNFLKIEKLIQGQKEAFPPGKVKELRSALKQGEAKTEHYLNTSHMYEITLESYQDVFKNLSLDLIGTGKGLERKIFIPVQGDEKEHSILFDAIEVMDTFIPLERKV